MLSEMSQIEDEYTTWHHLHVESKKKKSNSEKQRIEKWNKERMVTFSYKMNEVGGSNDPTCNMISLVCNWNLLRE